MDKNTREILWENILDLTKLKLKLPESVKAKQEDVRRVLGVGSSGLTAMSKSKRSVGIKHLDAWAEQLGVRPYQLLIPKMGNHLASWPFEKVPLERVTRLSPIDLGYVEGRLKTAVEECELAVDRRAEQATEQAKLDALSGATSSRSKKARGQAASTKRGKAKPTGSPPPRRS